MDINLDLFVPHTGHVDLSAILLFFVCIGVGFTSWVFLLHFIQYDTMVLYISLHKTTHTTFVSQRRYLGKIEKNIMHGTPLPTMNDKVDAIVATQNAIDILEHTRIIHDSFPCLQHILVDDIRRSHAKTIKVFYIWVPRVIVDSHPMGAITIKVIFEVDDERLVVFWLLG